MFEHEQTIPNLLTLATLNFVTGKIALNVADRPGLVPSLIRLLTEWPSSPHTPRGLTCQPSQNKMYLI